jgi:hypothetical protein
MAFEALDCGLQASANEMAAVKGAMRTCTYARSSFRLSARLRFGQEAGAQRVVPIACLLHHGVAARFKARQRPSQS